MGQGRTIAVLGGLVAALVAVGVWFALGDTEPPPEGGPGDAAASAPDAAPAPAPNEAEVRGSRRRSKVAGSCVVAGSVRRRKGSEPAAGQSVELVRDGDEVRSVACDAEGGFRFEQVPDGGPYEVRVAAQGFAPVRIPGIALTKHEERDVGTLWLDLAASVRVVVRTTADQPVAGARVEAFVSPEIQWNFDWTKALAQLAQEPVPVASRPTGADGTAVFDDIAGGTWTFVASKQGFAREGRSQIALRGGEAVREVKIYLSSGHPLNGRVLDGEGKPIAGAVVLVGRNVNAWDPAGSALRTRVVADAEGRYAATTLPSGDLGVMASRPGDAPALVATLRIPSVKAYDIVLRIGGTLQGTVTSATDGKPLGGLTVRAYSWGGSARTVEATTDAEGRYVMSGVPDGTIQDVRAEKEGWILDRRGQPPFQQPLVVPLGQTVTKDLKMRPGSSVRGTVTGPDGPVGGARVQVTSGRPELGTQSQKSAVSDADGKYQVAGLEPGKALVQASREGYYQKGFPENTWVAFQQPTTGAQFKVDVPEGGEATYDPKLDRGTRVEGRVESAEGPLADVVVFLGGIRTTTGDDGTFVADGVTPRAQVAVTLQKDGWLEARPEPVAVAPDTPTTGIVRTMTRQPVVRGRVTSAAGLTLLEPTVTVTWRPTSAGGWRGEWGEWEGGMGGGRPATMFPVRPDGTYEALVPGFTGKLVVRGTAVDHADAEQTLDLSADKPVYECDLALEIGGSIEGRVQTKDGSPLAAAEVTVRKAAAPRGMNMVMPVGMPQGGTIVAITDSAGVFRIANVAKGAYEVAATARGHVRGAKSDVKVPGATNLVVELDPALEIGGKVVFADGSPAGGIVVTPMGEVDEQPVMWDAGGMQNITDAAGGFRIRNLAPGNYRLQLQPNWNGSINMRNKRSDPIAAGVLDARVVVEAGATIAGRVVDAKKEGISGVWVNANRAQHDPTDPSGGWRGAMTGEDGTFELLGLSDGNYNLMIQANSGGYRPENRQDVPAGTKDLEVVLDTGLSIDGVLTKSDGSPVTEVWLMAQPKPEPGEKGAQNRQGGNGMTDGEGRFTIPGLAPGRYTLTVQSWNDPSVGWVLLGADDIAAGTEGLRLTASEGEKIAGIVVDEAGGPVAGANVNVNANNVWRMARSGDDGRFEVSGLPSTGTFTLHANAPGRVGQTVPDVAPGARNVRIVLAMGLKVSGRLVDAAGAAIPQAQLNFQRKAGSGGSGQGGCVTDAEGRFTCDGLAEGEYDVKYLKRTDKGQMQWIAVGTCRTGDTSAELRAP